MVHVFYFLINRVLLISTTLLFSFPTTIIAQVKLFPFPPSQNTATNLADLTLHHYVTNRVHEVVEHYKTLRFNVKQLVKFHCMSSIIYKNFTSMPEVLCVLR